MRLIKVKVPFYILDKNSWSFEWVFGTRLDSNPNCFRFGLTSEESRAYLPAKAHVVIALTTLLARRLILFKWKQHTPFFQSFSHWIEEVMCFLKLEKKSNTHSNGPHKPFSRDRDLLLNMTTLYRNIACRVKLLQTLLWRCVNVLQMCVCTHTYAHIDTPLFSSSFNESFLFILFT